MPHDARIRTAAWRGTLCTLAAFACGCGLDSRELSVTAGRPGDEPLPDASSRPSPDGAFAAWRSRRAAGSGSVDAAIAVDAVAPDSGGASGDGAGGEGGGDGSERPAIDAGNAGAASVPDECHALIVSSEWIDSFSNCLEIQGAPFVTTSDGGSAHNSHTVSPPICLQEQSPGPEGPTTLGVFLNQASPGAAPADYDARLHRVTGFRLRVSGYVDGEPIPYVGVESQGEIYCMPTLGIGEHEIELAKLRARCWEGYTGPAPDPEHIRSLLFYYPGGWQGEPIGMCFDDLFAIVAAP